MLASIASFVRDCAIWLLGGGALAAGVVILCHVRLRRLRARTRLARQVEDTLVQNTQGLILSVHGIVTELDQKDHTRQRTELTLDRADAELSELRDRIAELREEK
jgi:hypothetical protein